MNILYILLILFIISNIFYTLIIKPKYININNVENFDNIVKSYDNNINNNALIKYSSIKNTLNTIKDIKDIEIYLEELSDYFYIDINDIYINNNIEIINKINDNLTDLLRKTNEIKIKDPVYVILFYNYDINNKEEDNITIGKPMSYVKMIMIYPNYIKTSDNIFKKNNTNVIHKFFKKDNLNNKTIVYKLNKNYNIFTSKLD